ncbi:rRNA cytosine-C5-methyltransferase [Bacteroidia bacterium]|nr:rRNA cytosine-C5-methyltransferase [Bacteroidia bacterium]
MLPPAFIQAMQTLLGQDYSAFEEALQQPPVVSIRYNSSKIDDGQQPKNLPVPWCKEACYLPQRPVFTLDPLLHAGGYYVQEASSMLIAHIVRQLFTDPVTALDLCAAPGGKTTLLANSLPHHSVVVANEAIRHRAQILCENVTKWGNPNVIVCQNDPQDFVQVPPLFDLLLVDAPCSGEGLFRKDPSAQQEWSIQNVALCAQRQRRILANAWHCLREGGYLLYCTCTFNPQENEENVQWLMQNFDAQSVDVPSLEEFGAASSASLNLSNTVNGYHCFPHRVRGEGFFAAVLRKQSGAEEHARIVTKRTTNNSSSVADEIKNYLLQPQNFVWYESNDSIYAIPREAEQVLQVLKKHLRFVKAARPIAVGKGNKWQPTIDLALCANICKEAFVQQPLSLQDARNYLSMKPIESIVPSAKGIQLMTYEGLPLGFINHLGTRYNSLFPPAWRIRMDAKECK